MAKGTIFFLFILTILATFLLGINIGKKIGNPQSIQKTTSNDQSAISPTIIPSETFVPTVFSSPSASISTKKTTSSAFTDKTCGFSLKFPTSFLNQKIENSQSYILTNPDNPNDLIVTACQTQIPRPSLDASKIESILLDGVTATLYHDQSAKDGSPRDEVIVKHPTNGMEIIIAGYGPTFQNAITSFKFVR